MEETRKRPHDDEAERRARQGQSLAQGDTGNSKDAGVETDRQGISNRAGDTAAEPGEEAEDRPTR